MTVGDTLLEAGQAFRPGHLWIVTAIQSGQVLLFNCTGYCDGCDESCLLNPGDHPFIVKRTYVAYRRGQHIAADALAQAVSGGFYSPREPVDAHILRRIQDGALNSRFTKRGHKDMVTRQLGGGTVVVLRPSTRSR